MVRTTLGDLNTAHQVWQGRVDKERHYMNKNALALVRKHAAGAPARQQLQQSSSTPALLPSIDETRAKPSSPSLPRIPGASDRDALARPPTGMSESRLTERSLRSLPGGDAVGHGPVTMSVRSSQRLSSFGTSITGLTTASLRREVQEAVQQEVARAVQPLQDKLQSEKASRQRLEEMLRLAKEAGAGAAPAL
mmetsp:Transcript_52296/g.147203  ORF Transcript_52296/g.147203 Transcript_52296/m.147203 type:complete len:193 (+) Transcript_52296:86-664(+)